MNYVDHEDYETKASVHRTAGCWSVSEILLVGPAADPYHPTDFQIHTL